MQTKTVNISLFALACVLPISLGAVPMANAQTENVPTVCYRVTGLPSAGTVTTSNDPPVAVNVGTTFNQPPTLVYIPSAIGPHLLTYEVNNVTPGVPTGVFHCSETTSQSCNPNIPPNGGCPGFEFCREDTIDVCETTPVLDSATITFNIAPEGDACTSKGRGTGCGPDNQ